LGWEGCLLVGERGVETLHLRGGGVERVLDGIAFFGQLGQLLALLLARVPGRCDLRLQFLEEIIECLGFGV
jgi:hypothetical protein